MIRHVLAKRRFGPEESMADPRGDAAAGVDIDRRARLASVALAAAVLGLCGILGTLQMLERGRVEAAQRAIADATEAAVPVDGDSPMEGRRSLVELLPDKIDGFRTAGRHDVPGFEGAMAEAIYSPLDEEIRVRMPLNCYVVVRAPEGGSATEEFMRVSGRYPGRTEPAGLEELGTETSFIAHDRSTCVIGWVQGGQVVVVDARFTMATPAEAGDVLKLHAVAAATAVTEKIGR